MYSASVKPVSRGGGRSATAAAAYRNAEKIIDERTGEIHDYRRRSGVDYVESFAPEGMTPQPAAELWNRAEAAEVRRNARVAREVLVALPHELNSLQRRELATSIAQGLADRYGTAGTLAVHAPDKEGDNRNHHVHILMTTRRLEPAGELGEKTRELDDVKRGPEEVEWIRELVEVRTNRALELAGCSERVDRRSLTHQHAVAIEAGDHERANELDRPATQHEGPRVTQIRREAVKAQRAPLGALDRAAANDERRQLGADRAELRQVSAQILDFEKARVIRDTRAKEAIQLTGSAAIMALAAELRAQVGEQSLEEQLREQRTPAQIESVHQVKPFARPQSANQVELEALRAGLVPVETLVAAESKVIKARQELARMEAEVTEAKYLVVEIPEAVAKFCAEHSLIAARHDLGWKLAKSSDLVYCEESLKAAQSTLSYAETNLRRARHDVDYEQRAATGRIREANGPVMARIAGLESAVSREMASDDAGADVLQNRPTKARSVAVRRSGGPVRHGPDLDEQGMGMD